MSATVSHTTTTTSSASSVASSTLSSLSADFRANLDQYVQYSKGKASLNNRYSFISNLQTGSFGKVSCAFDTYSNRKVAIKALKKSVSGVATMAQHEVSIMKQLGYHKNVTQLLDYFETKKYYIMVLEFADSGDLYDAIHNKTPLGLALQNNHLAFANFLSQILDVIQFSHSRGIYHRDIKPENILLMNDGTIKLCDWGLSTNLLISSDYNVGTEKYMAPEALVKGNYNCQHLDAYSLGITLLFTLFNRCPFRKASLEDTNYSAFIRSQHFIYDFFPNISNLAFEGIINKLLLQRDFNGVKYMIENAYQGFTLDQEHQLSFDELFLYDHNTTTTTTVATSANEEESNDFEFEQQEFQANNHNSSNLQPISIPMAPASSSQAVAMASASIGSSYVPHSASLFDKNIWDSNSFMNSFELNHNDWKI